MKRALFALAFIALSCAGGRGAVGTTAVPGHGAIALQIVPNPVVATKAGGDQYEFPFEVVLRETGGHPVEITNVSATVFALGGIQIASESYDAARIAQLGYSTHLPANGELRYRFNPRRSVTDDRLFSNVSADIRVDARDETGTATSATSRVSVTRG